MTAGKAGFPLTELGYPRNREIAPCSRKIAATASSRSAVLTPGTASRRTWSSAWATTRPASRIRPISRGLLSLITARVSNGKVQGKGLEANRASVDPRPRDHRVKEDELTFADQTTVVPHDQVAVNL